MVFPCLLCRSGAQPGSADLHPSMLRVSTRWACHGYGDTGPALLTSEKTNWICRTSFIRVANFPRLQTYGASLRLKWEKSELNSDSSLPLGLAETVLQTVVRPPVILPKAPETRNRRTARGETWTQSLLHLATKLKMDHRKGRSSTCNLNMTQENCTYVLRKNGFGGISRITKAGACSRLLRSFLPAVDIDPPKKDRHDVANLKKHISWTVSFSPIKSCYTIHLVHHSMYIYILNIIEWDIYIYT